MAQFWSLAFRIDTIRLQIIVRNIRCGIMKETDEQQIQTTMKLLMI